MLVCDCNEVDYEAVKEAVKEHGNNLKAIMEDTEAGSACECCLDEDCDKVDIGLHQAIKKALSEI